MVIKTTIAVLKNTYTDLFIPLRISFIRNSYWDSQMAKKFSVLKPRRNLKFFPSFSYCNFEDKVTNFEKDMFKKESELRTRW